MNEKIEEVQCIVNPILAKKLIEECGFVVIGIKPNKNNKQATVFLFERTDALMAEVEKFKKSK